MSIKTKKTARRKDSMKKLALALIALAGCVTLLAVLINEEQKLKKYSNEDFNIMH